MSVSRHDGSTVILGTEAGLIFQASLNSINEMEPDKLDLAGIAIDDGKWFDPVKSTFAGHTGRVLDIKVTKEIKTFEIFISAFEIPIPMAITSTISLKKNSLINFPPVFSFSRQYIFICRV
jgi:hypothetical protein